MQQNDDIRCLSYWQLSSYHFIATTTTSFESAYLTECFNSDKLLSKVNGLITWKLFLSQELYCYRYWLEVLSPSILAELKDFLSNTDLLHRFRCSDFQRIPLNFVWLTWTKRCIGYQPGTCNQVKFLVISAMAFWFSRHLFDVCGVE